jgi:hypothetical protein
VQCDVAGQVENEIDRHPEEFTRIRSAADVANDRFATANRGNRTAGSGPDSQSGELAACLPSFELMTPVC